MTNYEINCALLVERNGDTKTRDELAVQWEPVLKLPEGRCGNLKAVFSDGKCKIVSAGASSDATELWRRIPAALLLYRIACTFEAKVNFYGPDGYKVCWEAGLRHKASGEVLILGEWKGGANMFTKHHNQKDASQDFIRDAERLLTYICGATCAHPYDRTVAGSVA